MPRIPAISRCFNFSSFRILKTWYPICARARSWSASFRPRSARTFPEPSSNLIALRFFVLMRQFLCFRVPLLDQLNVAPWGFNAFLRFLLKGMQNINPPSDLYRQHDTVSVGGISQGNLENAAAAS